MGSARPSRSCAFCGGDAAAYGGKLGKLEGPFNASKSTFEPVYVHTQCAVWSPNISQNVDLKLRSVGKEVRRARTLKCSSCGRNGAATGCRVPSCGRCYHLPCAINQNCSFNFELYLMSCPEHLALFKREPAGQAAERQRGTLAHLKLSGRRQQHNRYPALAAAAGGGSSRGLKRRNKMTAAQLGDHIDAVKAAYASLVEELEPQDGSEPDEAIIAAKDAKRMKKATQQLAPTLLGHPAAAAAPTVPAGHPSAAIAQPQAESQQPAKLPPQLVFRRQQQQQQQQQAVVGQPEKPWQPPAGGFGDIGGLSNVKRQLKEMVLMPLMYPEVMQQLGIQPPRGILLHGPPGCGKTAIVRALAAECATASSQAAADPPGTKPVALFARKGTDCLGKYAGDAELHLRLLFDMAAAAAPSIIFLDELDGLVPARSVRSSSNDQIFASVVSVMLALMDGITDRGQVLIIGATNRPDSIDPALRRPGRFDREVYFNLPTQQDRQDILTVQTRRWPEQQQPSPELLQQLAAATDGWAGADLQSLTAGALLSAVRTAAPNLIAAIDKGQQQQQRSAAAAQQQRQDGEVPAPHNDQQQQQRQQAAEQQRPQRLPAMPTQGHADAAAPAASCCATVAAIAAGTAGADVAASKQPCDSTARREGSARSGLQLLSTSPSTPTAAATVGGGTSPHASRGFLAALSSFVSEQQQQQPSWLAPLHLAGSRSPGVPACVVAEAEALAAARRSPLGTTRSSPAPTLRAESPQAAAQSALAVAQGSAIRAGACSAAADFTTNTAAAVTAKWRGQDLELKQSSQMQQQRLRQHQDLSTMQYIGAGKQDVEASGQQQQQAAAQQSTPGAGQGASHPQLQQQKVTAVTGQGIDTLADNGQAVTPDIHVLPCDWLSALAAAGPPASKREMSSLAALNPAEHLPAILPPLLLPALARVVLLLHRWLLLLADGTDELASAAAAVASGLGSSCSDDQSCVLFEQLLAQYGVEEQLKPAAVKGLQTTAPNNHNLTNRTSTAAAEVGSISSTSSRCHPTTARSSYTPSSLSGRTHHMLPHSSACYSLLLSGHGAAGQPELAAAVLKLLGSAAAAAVHNLSLPGLLLLGDGDVGKGLVAGVREAVARTGRGQLVVLYVPRLELWALEPAKHKRSHTAAAAATHSDKASHFHASTLHGAWDSKAGALHGIISSSSSGSDSSSNSSSDDNSDLDQMNAQMDPNNAMHSPADLAVQPSAHNRANFRSKRAARHMQRQSKQQQQQHRLSSAWGIFEQQLAVLPSGDQCVLLLATSHVPVEELPQEVLQVFGADQNLKQQQQQQHGLLQQQWGATMQRHRSRSSCHTAGSHCISTNSSAATVQTCGCGWRGGGKSATAAAAEAVLQDCLDRAAAVAVQQFSQQLMHTCLSSQALHAQHHHQQQQQVASQHVLPEGHGTVQWGVQGGQQVRAETGQADAVQRQHQQQSIVVPLQQQVSQQQPQLALHQLNDAQQAQARRLLAQVQQLLCVLGSMLLQDAALRQAVGKQPRRTGRAAKAKQQQQPWQQVLPLAAVCLKAIRGWYCHVDDFQTDFAAAAEVVRRAHACEEGYSRAAAAAARLEDVVGAACREAAWQLQLYDSNNVKLLQAVAAATKGATQQQQCKRQQMLQQQRTMAASKHHGEQAEPSAAGGMVNHAPGADVAVSRCFDHAPADSTAAPKKAGTIEQERVWDEQQQQLQIALQHLAVEHTQRWRQLQEWRGSRDAARADESLCWADLHSAVQQYCRVAACRVSLALEQATAATLKP